MKVFFDENFSKYLAIGMSELQKGMRHEGIEVLHSVEVFGKGIADVSENDFRRHYSGISRQ